MRLWKRSAPALAACVVLAACDIPSGLPRIETRLVVPGESVTLGVGDLLPSVLTEEEGAFRLQIGPQAIPATSLREMCPPCGALDGAVVPKPSFTATIEIPLPLPEEVVSATVAGGSVHIAITHTLGFDPLQPRGRTTDGWIDLALRSGGSVVGTTRLDGAFPSGSTRTATVALVAGDVSQDLEVTLEIVSPAGGSSPADWVVIDADAVLYGSITPADVRVSEARFTLEQQSVDVTGTTLDLTDIDADERIKRGAVTLTTTNPFAVTGTLQLRLSGEGGTVRKPLQIAPGETVQRIELTGEELQSLLGHEVTISLAGTVGSSGIVIVQPGQRITFDTMLDLVFELGSED